MSNKKASERLDYWLSDLYDKVNGVYEFLVLWFVLLVCFPISIITLLSIVAGIFHFHFLFSELFFNLTWYYYPIWIITLPIIIPLFVFFITFMIIGAVIWHFIKGFFKL